MKIGLAAPTWLSLTGIARQVALFNHHMQWAQGNLTEYVNFMLDKIKGANSFTVEMPRAEFLLAQAAKLTADLKARTTALKIVGALAFTSTTGCIYLYCTRPADKKEGQAED